MSATDRNDLARNTKDPSIVQHDIENALTSAKGIPLKAYKVTQVPIEGMSGDQGSAIEEF